ncbi:signal recognition particle-docking protein FtsY [Candidatus Pantoea edessiphila]|uniref:Signal recognition particle receptor FtsY n=1 Tax=Candidatus Pantoea edessiphila TaxID=2044610 RepID=A0A2P5SVV5_9GAMM|nr:signal recognition particle-docking protein FtsY [Candidatus Pantoea edessiphila]PPI86469.1 signal recognition particle-docking protein FtsY [Candidatus Pantoea edessiphila]
MVKKTQNSFLSWLGFKKKDKENKNLLTQKNNTTLSKKNETSKQAKIDVLFNNQEISLNEIDNRHTITQSEIIPQHIQNNDSNSTDLHTINKSIEQTDINHLNSLNDTPNYDIISNNFDNKKGFFTRLKNSLIKTRQNLAVNLIKLFRGKAINNALFKELEEHLLIADVGAETTKTIIERISKQAYLKGIYNAENLYDLLKFELIQILEGIDIPLTLTNKKPFIILVVGVNGVGKTTTVGKLAYHYSNLGKSVILAAGDTFRAAAIDQLQFWGQKYKIPVIAQNTGSDPSAVIFDSIKSAKSRESDIVIADTAGRIHNKMQLMEELRKTIRVIKKLDDSAPHEIMLVIDANTGQNAILQAKLFHQYVKLTGIVVTKLDGTAKGGIIFSIANQLAIPIRYICIGEKADDLKIFKSADFIKALFSQN